MDKKQVSTFLSNIMAVVILTFLFTACNDKTESASQSGIVTEQLSKWKQLNIKNYTFLMSMASPKGDVSRYLIEVKDGFVVNQHPLSSPLDVDGTFINYAIYDLFLNIVYLENSEQTKHIAYHPRYHYPTIMEVNVGDQVLTVSIDGLKASPFKAASL